MSLRAYGWHNDGTIIEEEAAEIRRWAEHIAAGGAVRPLVNDLNDRGVPTVTGKAWATPTITRALVAPRMIGKKLKNGELVDSDVEPILDRETWERVRAILTDPARKKFAGRKNPPTLLAGVLRCAKCGKNLHATGPSYACSARYGGCGEIGISQRLADAEATERVLIRLTDEHWRRAIRDARKASTVAYERDIADAEARIQHLAEVFGDGGDREAFDAGVAKARETIEHARNRLALLSATGALPDTLTERAVVEWWLEAPVTVRREMIRVVVDHIEVRPKAESEPGTGASDRMTFRWAE